MLMPSRTDACQSSVWTPRLRRANDCRSRFGDGAQRCVRRSRRLLEAGEAARAGLELADSPFFRRLLELQLRLAELCDTDAHLYEEAIADAGVEPGEQVVGDT